MNTTTDSERTETTTHHCETCGGYGVVRSYSMSPEAACDIEACPDCDGDMTVPEEPEGDTPIGIADDDGEPADIDSDAGYDPYTGGAEDDGYDTGCFDDGFCDSDF